MKQIISLCLTWMRVVFQTVCGFKCNLHFLPHFSKERKYPGIFSTTSFLHIGGLQNPLIQVTLCLCAAYDQDSFLKKKKKLTIRPKESNEIEISQPEVKNVRNKRTVSGYTIQSFVFQKGWICFFIRLCVSVCVQVCFCIREQESEE